MKGTAKYLRFFSFSKTENKYFNTEFKSGINIIHGKNTSGKSTLIQLILYTFGINDEKLKLEEVLNEDVLLRLDFLLTKKEVERVTIIRDGELLVVKAGNRPVKKFTGISGDNSEEHKSLKKYLADLFGFNLFLESSGEYKSAAIESIFLPYYIAQDVGWVYKHKSFRGLDFVKNFKFDFFDYYLGVSNNYDRDEKARLESKKSEIKNEIKFLTGMEEKKYELNVSKLIDEQLIVKSVEYIEPYRENKQKLIELEKKYLIECNKLSYLEQRKLVLSRVRLSLKNQKPSSDDCPACNRALPNELGDFYEYFQDVSDTDRQLSAAKEEILKLKSTKSTINTLKKKIIEIKSLISKDYQVLDKYSADGLSFNSWVDNKANVRLSENITTKIGLNTSELTRVETELKRFKTPEQIDKDRYGKSREFKLLFEKSLRDLGVKPFSDERFLLLYQIPAFPRQGVELLKTMLAYSFAFNKIIKSTDYVQRLPFLLDAIFEGDLDDLSKRVILDFIYKNKPIDTQVIMSIADSEDNKVSVIDYNKNNLRGEAHLICIGGNIKERAFLIDYDKKHDEYLQETLSILG